MYYHNPAKPASQAQLELLKKLGIATSAWLSRYRADQLIKENHDKWAALPPTWKQKQLLQMKWFWEDGMTRGEAAEWIGKLTGKQDWPLGMPKGVDEHGSR